MSGNDVGSSSQKSKYDERDATDKSAKRDYRVEEAVEASQVLGCLGKRTENGYESSDNKRDTCDEHNNRSKHSKIPFFDISMNVFYN